MHIARCWRIYYFSYSSGMLKKSTHKNSRTKTKKCAKNIMFACLRSSNNGQSADDSHFYVHLHSHISFFMCFSLQKVKLNARIRSEWKRIDGNLFMSSRKREGGIILSLSEQPYMCSALMSILHRSQCDKG